MRNRSSTHPRAGIVVIVGALLLTSTSCMVHQRFDPSDDPPIGRSMRLEFSAPQAMGLIARDEDGGAPAFPARSLDNIFDYPALGSRPVTAVVGQVRRVTADSLTIRFREVYLADLAPSGDTLSYHWEKLRRPVLATVPRAAVRGEGSQLSGRRTTLLVGSVVLTLLVGAIALLAARDPLA